jgi:competence ComEA-like helix-hairpin-helix protein
MAEIVKLNTAETDELTNLPGVGPAMAERIVAARPFHALEDLLKVSGIGPALLERLSPLVEVSELEGLEEDDEVIFLEAETEPPSEAAEISEEGYDDTAIPDIVDSEPEKDVDVEEAIPKEKAIIPVEEPDTEEKAPAKKPKPVTWGQVFLIAAGCSLAAFLLAVLLSLGIIGSLNGGLRYASTQQMLALNRQVEALDLEISTLSQDIDGLRERVDNLESLSGRIGELESEVDGLILGIGGLEDAIEGINAEIAEFADHAERFQSFLEGLGDLLDSLVTEPQEVP